MLKIIFLVAMLIILITIFIIEWHFSNMIIYPKVEDTTYTYDFEVEKGRIEIKKYNDLEKQEVYIDSEYGYKLHGFFFPNNNSKKKL